MASLSFVVPLGLSLSSRPSSNHPKSFLWYRSLRKPGFKPPDWVFPAAWTAIETGLAAAAYRLFRAPSGEARSRAIALWAWNVGMIGGWSRLFFKQHRLATSTTAAASLVATSTAFVVESDKVDRTASRAGMPLVGWATFATALTATIWYLNRRRSR